MLVLNNFTTPKDAQIIAVKGSVQSELPGQTSLQNGGSIPLGTVLTLNKGSEISLSFDDGSQQRISLPLGEGESTLSFANIADEGQFINSPQLADAEASASDLSDIEAIQALIESSEDDIETPDTAAGGDNNEGSSTVTIARDGEEVLAQAGVDSVALAQSQALVAEQLEAQLDPQPTLTQPDLNVSPEDSIAAGNVLDNDSDVDDALSIQSFTVEGDGTVYLAGQTAPVEDGTLTVNANGTYNFEPAADWNGEVPVVTYLTNTNATAVSYTHLRAHET